MMLLLIFPPEHSSIFVLRINNQVYDGYSWAKANYLSPVAINEMRLASPDNSTDNSVIYQNPYWPEKVGGTALE